MYTITMTFDGVQRTYTADVYFDAAVLFNLLCNHASYCTLREDNKILRVYHSSFATFEWDDDKELIGVDRHCLVFDEDDEEF